MEVQIAHDLGAVGIFLFWSGCGWYNNIHEKFSETIKSTGYAGALVIILKALSVMV